MKKLDNSDEYHLLLQELLSFIESQGYYVRILEDSDHNKHYEITRLLNNHHDVIGIISDYSSSEKVVWMRQTYLAIFDEEHLSKFTRLQNISEEV